MVLTNYKEKLQKTIEKASTIFISGHKDLDLDAVGAAIGMCEIVKSFHKKAYIILNDAQHESAVQNVLNETEDKYDYIKSQNIGPFLDKKSLLIIVDTNKQERLQDHNLLDKFSNIVIIDHHVYGENSITEGLLILDENSSSTCEMISDLFRLYDIRGNALINTIILSGIVLDTNNFVLKTSANTYYSAYYLAENGANPRDVQILLKQDVKKYIKQEKVITNLKIINQVGITYGDSKIIYRKDDLARIADKVLQFKGVKASIVIGKISPNRIGISSRSNGAIPIRKIMESFEGGGDKYNAAAQIKNKSIKEVREAVEKIVKDL